MLWYNHCFVQLCLLIGTVSEVSDVANGPLVFWFFLLGEALFHRITEIGFST